MLRLLSLVALFGLTLFAACNRGLNTQFVEGTVFLDEKPLPDALVTIQPLPDSGGELASGFSNENGVFTLTSETGQGGRGALQGSYLVTVSCRDVKTIPGASGDPDDNKVVVKELLPEIYRDAERTPLRIDIRKGRNKVRLDLSNP